MPLTERSRSQKTKDSKVAIKIFQDRDGAPGFMDFDLSHKKLEKY